MEDNALQKLRVVINESLRVKKYGGKRPPYIDSGSVLSDINTRHNHVVFARRGCGKTLLLNESEQKVEKSIRVIYIDCEDYKRHSYPNVLLEILLVLLERLQRYSWSWTLGRRKIKKDLTTIIGHLEALKEKPDHGEEDVIEKSTESANSSVGGQVKLSYPPFTVADSSTVDNSLSNALERRYKKREEKQESLEKVLIDTKKLLERYFNKFKSIKAVFIQLDDYYHLGRADQPFVIDFFHRLCKNLPLFFKVATIRHASSLYVEQKGQPVGIQERQDYQPIVIDFSLADFGRTVERNKSILYEYGILAGVSNQEIDSLFKGQGLQRLVLAGGGVPRDCLSLLLEAMNYKLERGERIGKDEMRQLSRTNTEHRISELKQESGDEDSAKLIRAVYAMRSYYLSSKTNIFLIADDQLQKHEWLRALLNRLIEYKIIHTASHALTHKTYAGSYQAYAIDFGFYAHMRVLLNKMDEIDLMDGDAKEMMRSAPIFDVEQFTALLRDAPDDSEKLLVTLPLAE